MPPLHVPHTAPYLPPPPPSTPPPPKKKLHNLCFSFLTGISAVPRETENNASAKYWGANKVRIHYGKCASGVCIYVNKVNKLANPLSIFSLCVLFGLYQFDVMNWT